MSIESGPSAKKQCTHHEFSQDSMQIENQEALLARRLVTMYWDTKRHETVYNNFIGFPIHIPNTFSDRCTYVLDNLFEVKGDLVRDMAKIANDSAMKVLKEFIPDAVFSGESG